jgi:hypothetical protein
MALSKRKQEEEQEEEKDPLATIFADFDRATEKLDEIPRNAQTKTEALLSLFFPGKDKDPKDIFEDQQEFLEKLNDLSEEIGHAYHTVLSIELARQQISPQQIQNAELSSQTKPSVATGQPIVVNAAPPQQLGVFSGGWYYGAERSRSKALVEIARLQQQQNAPQISTAARVLDILDFGRQLIPEFNRVQEYYQKSIEHLKFFPDSETRDRFTAELRKHLNKLAGIIRAFCQTIAEYRKDLIHEGKKDVAKALMAMKMAEANSLGGMRMSDFYKAMREAAGPQDAGR